MEDKLAALRHLAGKATPGPWRPIKAMHGVHYWITDQTDRPYTILFEATDIAENVENNILFAAAANPQTILELLDEIEYLRSEILNRESAE